MIFTNIVVCIAVGSVQFGVESIIVYVDFSSLITFALYCNEVRISVIDNCINLIFNLNKI